MAKKNESIIEINPANDDFGLILNCAVRYAIGRRTYMPFAVISFITPLLHRINDRTLNCLDIDIVNAKYEGGYGDPCDERDWLSFHEKVKEEKIRRGHKLYVHRNEREEN